MTTEPPMHRCSKNASPRLCALLERAQASQNIGMAQAVFAHDPQTGATALELPGAIGVFLGEGHPMNQGLALLGLGGELDERGSRRAGGAPRPRRSPRRRGADPWRRRRSRASPRAAGLLRQAVSAIVDARGGRDDRRAGVRSVRGPRRQAARGRALRPPRDGRLPRSRRAAPRGGAARDSPVGGGGDDGVDRLGRRPARRGGDARPRGGRRGAVGGRGAPLLSRPRGLRRALVRARVAAARLTGARVAVSATAPSSTSGEKPPARLGFRAAYSEVEMANG